MLWLAAYGIVVVVVLGWLFIHPVPGTAILAYPLAGFGLVLLGCLVEARRRR